MADGSVRSKKTKYAGVRVREKTANGTVYDVHVTVGGKVYPPKLGEFTDLEEAYRFRVDWLNRIHRGQSLSVNARTLGEFIEKDWLPELRRKQRAGKRPSATTLAQYRSDATGRIARGLGHEKLPAIDRSKINDWIDELEKDGLANWSIIRLGRTLHLILEAAKAEGYILANPASRVTLPEAKRKKEPLILTVEEFDAATAKIKARDEQNLVRLLAYSGLRIGEALGLKWASVFLDDPDGEHLIVSQHVYGGRVIKGAKTKAGARIVTLGGAAILALRDQQITGRANAEGIVFPAPGRIGSEGTYWNSSNFNERQWTKAREQMGYPELTLHDLRHFHTSHLRSGELDELTTMQLTGHRSLAVHNLYTHLTPEMRRKARAGLDKTFPPSVS